MAKLLENTYRQINIALVNEMAKFSHDLGIDIWEVIRCAATKPFGFAPFWPGAGVGGHCIPIDPSYLSHRVQSRLGYPFRFVELAQEINRSMPRYLAQRAQGLLNDRAQPVQGLHGRDPRASPTSRASRTSESPQPSPWPTSWSDSGPTSASSIPSSPSWRLETGQLEVVDSPDVLLRGVRPGAPSTAEPRRIRTSL